MNLTTDFMIAFVKMQSELPVIGKSTRGNNFTYATFAHVCGKIYPVLTKHGFAVSQVLDNFEGQPSVRAILMHISGGYIEGNYPIQAAGMKTAANSSQQFGAAIQYTRRYGLLSITGTPTDDEDADSIGQEDPPRQDLKDQPFDMKGNNPREDMNKGRSYTPGAKTEKPQPKQDHAAKEVTATKAFACPLCDKKGKAGDQMAFKREDGNPYWAHWDCYLDHELAKEK